jgi:receptor protein-tyrosine kinase
MQLDGRTSLVREPAAAILPENDNPIRAGIDFAFPPRIDELGSTDRQGVMPPSIAFNAGRCRQDRILLPKTGEIETRNEFRVIKRKLLTVLGKQEEEIDYPKVILITSACPGEGKTFVALNLALSLADERDLEVLLVEGDVVNPSLSRYFASGCTREGLTELLAGKLDAPEKAIHACEGVPNFSVMFAGQPDPRSPELMAGPRMPEILTQLHRTHPNLLIVIDCAPVISPEPAALAGQVSHAIIVVGAEQASRSELQDAVDAISPCGNISLVFNKSPRWRKKNAYYYGYAYGAKALNEEAQLERGAG